VRLEEISFRYRRGSPWVLRQASLALPPGQIVEISGANGAGKSTLLRLIAGVLRPTRGRVTDRPVQVGYAPERFPADQPFTPRAYLEHMARIRRLSSPAITDWADQLNLADLLDTPLRNLSKGSAHKVALIQALMPKPELLVLDEPFAGLDAQSRKALATALASQSSSTIVVTDHQHVLTPTTRLRLADKALRATAQSPTHTVIEVTVPLEDAAALLTDLRSRGYPAHPRIPVP
jgi:ABC-2 type transport system ATP-binding protein